MTVLQVIGVLVAGTGSAVLFNVPPRALPWVALVGLSGWGVQSLAAGLGWGAPSSVLAGALLVAMAGEGLARSRRMPATVFVVPGILPLVPGTRAYQAMLALMNHDRSLAFDEGVNALLGAGGIAVGILLATALTRAGQAAVPETEGPNRPAPGRRPAPRPGVPSRASVPPVPWGRRRSRR